MAQEVPRSDTKEEKYDNGIIGKYEKTINLSLPIAHGALLKPHTGNQVYVFVIVQRVLACGRNVPCEYGVTGSDLWASRTAGTPWRSPDWYPGEARRFPESPMER